MSVEPIVEFSFGIAAQGYEPSAVDARLEELALDHEHLLRRAQDLQREIAETSRAIAARGEQAQFAFVLGRLQSTLGAAYAESTGLQRAGEGRGRDERGAAHETTQRQLAAVDEESARAVAAAQTAARQLIEEAGRAAAEIRAEAEEAAARIAAGAQDVWAAARSKTEQRTKEIVGELTAWQQARENAQAAAQAAADGRVEQAGRAAEAVAQQARSAVEHATQTASRMTGEARLEADKLLAESQRGADHLRQEAERAAAEVAVNLRSIGRFVDGLPLPAGLVEPAAQADRPAAEENRGSISDISTLWPRRRTRNAGGQEPARSERIR